MDVPQACTKETKGEMKVNWRAAGAPAASRHLADQRGPDPHRSGGSLDKSRHAAVAAGLRCGPPSRLNPGPAATRGSAARGGSW